MARNMTPEQRERKNARDRERRAEQKVARDKETAAINQDLAKLMPGKPVAAPKPKPKAAKAAPRKPKTAPKPRGGKRPGSGGVCKYDAPMVVVAYRMTAEQRDKLARLGGGEWVRAKVDAAKEK